MTIDLTILVLGLEGSPGAEATRAALRQVIERGSCQVFVVDGLSEASALVETPFVSLLMAGDLPGRDAVSSIRDAIQARPDLDVLYGDEDRIDADGHRTDPFHKPGWSPERLWGQGYLGSMVTYRSSLMAETIADGDVDVEEAVSSQMHELSLSVSLRARVVGHLPAVLCHRPMPTSERFPSSIAAVQRHFDRIGLCGLAIETGPSGSDLIGFEPALQGHPPLVSIIIPTGGSKRTVRGRSFVLVENAIRSVIANSTHQVFEIVIVVDAKSTDELATRLRSIDPRVRTVKDDRPFNFAAACNLGVAQSSGTMVVLLNDDTEVVTANWMERLLTLTALDDVGAVGVKLFYGDGRIQHGGVATRGTGPDHLYHGYPGDDPGHGDWLRLTVNCFAATGACLAIRRDHWEAVDGMDEQFPLNYNDIDLCLRLADQGWRTVVDNQTELMHLETSSRPPGSESWEVEAFRARWGRWLDNDPYDNPNLVTMGLLQVPPPPALTAIAEHRGTGRHRLRVWTTKNGFELPVVDERMQSQH